MKIASLALTLCLCTSSVYAAAPAQYTGRPLDQYGRPVDPVYTICVDQTGAYVSCGSGGAAGASPPYVFTSTGFVAVTSFSTATGFTPPATSTVCFITPEGNPVRFRTDGTNPTATVGQLVPANSQLALTANLTGVKFIPTTGSATLDVDCYK